jgi:hypothetical protein
MARDEHIASNFNVVGALTGGVTFYCCNECRAVVEELCTYEHIWWHEKLRRAVEEHDGMIG